MPEKSNFYLPDTFSYWKAYFIQMRPYLLFVSGIAGLAGMSIVFQESFNLQFYILGFISFFLAYGFGQALTDCFQMDNIFTDANNTAGHCIIIGQAQKVLLG